MIFSILLYIFIQCLLYIVYIMYVHVKYIFNYFLNKVCGMSHNVPAVYESFYGAIKKCVAFCAIKTLGGVKRGRRSRPSETEPQGAKRRSVYRPVRRSAVFLFYSSFYYFYILFLIIILFCYGLFLPTNFPFPNKKSIAFLIF
jgi:hypothetical protein